MKNKIVLTAAAICMAATSLNAVYASNIKTIINDGDITYAGTVDKENIGKNIFFQVYKNGYEINETNWSTEDKTNIIFADTDTSDSNGNYSFSFNLTANGKYPLIKNYGDDDGEAVEYIGYTKSSDFSAAVAELAGKTGNDVADYINANKEKLAMYDDIFNLSANDVITLVENSIKTDSDYADLLMVYAAGNFSKGNDVSLNDYIDDMLGENDKIKKYYKDYNEALYTAKLKKTYSNISDFYSTLEESVILSNVYKNDGVSDVTAMLNDYARTLGINVTVTDKKTDQVVGKTWTKTELAKTINELPEDVSGGGSGGAGSSSSSGWSVGGSSGGNTAIVGTPVSSVNSAGTEIFNDISDAAWAKEAINALFNKGVVSGKGNGTYAPNDNVAREELISMLVREIQLNVTGADPAFGDVDKDAWYYSALKAAYNCGIANGYSEDYFGIGDKITREDMATMIYNALTICGIDIPEVRESAEFADKDAISDYAKTAVDYLYKRGIINGYEDGSFAPKNNATRAEVAVMLYKILPYTKLGK